ncbi:hypothetical protein RHSIM_Rhsim02G0102800 [Rhododendron simsii]|uniref:Uncharacterized protein n=1 Tax=Rhododendron simsii TaxID=118357 RepID=A0A834LT93_RHOSS|nr:hypothetical protein RHSIM_Rhsim02G0102800 [Rhododendron simsii]
MRDKLTADATPNLSLAYFLRDVAGGAVIVKKPRGVLFGLSGKEFYIRAQRVELQIHFFKDAFIEALQQPE